MESIRFFSGTQTHVSREKATPIGEEIRLYLDGPEDVCAIMGQDMPEQTACGYSKSVPTALGNLASELDSLEDQIFWLKEGPVYVMIMSQKTIFAGGETPIDALINLAKALLSLDWVPNLEA